MLTSTFPSYDSERLAEVSMCLNKDCMDKAVKRYQGIQTGVLIYTLSF
jgi:hypothetical protein